MLNKLVKKKTIDKSTINRPHKRGHNIYYEVTCALYLETHVETNKESRLKIFTLKTLFKIRTEITKSLYNSLKGGLYHIIKCECGRHTLTDKGTCECPLTTKFCRNG